MIGIACFGMQREAGTKKADEALPLFVLENGCHRESGCWDEFAFKPGCQPSEKLPLRPGDDG
ncbi:MAG: hypothetical protein JWM04_1760 [Verrucomicrobiales bacterium]|nr:hypothetical protein [Verrucomicrobiales bacterium]